MTIVNFNGLKLDRDQALLELDRYDCEESLYVFLQEAWKYIDPSQFTPGFPIEAIAEHLQAVTDGEIRRLIINIPPRCSKSTLVSVAFPAWTWAQRFNSPTSGPGVSFLHASYAHQLSLRDSVKCRRLIESPWYQKLWGEKYTLTTDQNTKSRFQNSFGGERLITSIGAAVTGEGGSCFPAWVRVATPRGNIRIEDLRVDDFVFAYDFVTNMRAVSKILAVKQRQESELLSITTTYGKMVWCTMNHPFYVLDRGYIVASELKCGDTVIVNGHDGLVLSDINGIEQAVGEPTAVYDIQIETHNNFFAEGILVHNCIIIDDPNAAQEAFSEATIQTTIDWWDNTMSTRLNDAKTGAYIIIQQRLSEEDLTGHILSKDVGDWTHLYLPMRFEQDRACSTSIGWTDPRETEGELLWPERFGETEVKLLERQLGPFQSAGQLQQRPEPKGGGVIKREWWRLWEKDKFPPLEYVIASLDTAYTTKTENDFSALTVWGVFSSSFTTDEVAKAPMFSRGQTTERLYDQPYSNVMLLHAWQDRLELHELVEKAAETCRRMKIDKLLIENKASGISVAQEIRRLYGYEDFAVQLVDPKSQDKLSRLYSVQHLFAEGMIYAPDKSWADMVITQVASFPKGKHDDLVDTVSQSLRHLRDIGLLTRSTEKQAEMKEGMVHRGAPPKPIYPV